MNKRNKLITLAVMGIILLGLMQYNKVLVFDNLLSEDIRPSENTHVAVRTLDTDSHVALEGLTIEEIRQVTDFLESNEYKRSYKKIDVEEIETEIPFFIELRLSEHELLTIYSHGMVSVNKKNYRLYFEGFEKANESQDALTKLYYVLIEE